MLWRSARASSRSFVTSSTSRCRLRIVARSRGTQNEAKTPYPWLSSVNVLCCSTSPSSSFSSASPRGSFSLPLILPPPGSRRDMACPATLLKAREHLKGQVGPARNAYRVAGTLGGSGAPRRYPVRLCSNARASSRSLLTSPRSTAERSFQRAGLRWRRGLAELQTRPAAAPTDPLPARRIRSSFGLGVDCRPRLPFDGAATVGANLTWRSDLHHLQDRLEVADLERRE